MLNKYDARGFLRSVGWILLSLVTGVAMFYLWTSDTVDSTIQKSTATPEEPLILAEPELMEFENDRLKLRLIAENALVFEQKKQTQMESILAYLYEQDESEPSTRITADQGEMNSKTNVLRLWGSVIIELKDGQHLLTEELFVHRLKKIIYNDCKVTAISGNDRIEAIALHYNFSRGILVLKEPNALIEL